jgi:uncharacterized protein (UPF0297 family)
MDTLHLTLEQLELRTPNYDGLIAEKRRQQEDIFRKYAYSVYGNESLPDRSVNNVSGFLSSLLEKELITPKQNYMTDENDAETVIRHIRDGEWSCEELIEAYIKRQVYTSS